MARNTEPASPGAAEARGIEKAHIGPDHRRRDDRIRTEGAVIFGHRPGTQPTRMVMGLGRRCRDARSSLVDTPGAPIRLVAHPAGVEDRDGAALPSDRAEFRLQRRDCLFADTRYDAQSIYEAAGTDGLQLERASHHVDAVGFMAAKGRRVFERTLSSVGRNQRLAQDLAATLSAAVILATGSFDIKRPARSSALGSGPQCEPGPPAL